MVRLFTLAALIAMLALRPAFEGSCSSASQPSVRELAVTPPPGNVSVSRFALRHVVSSASPKYPVDSKLMATSDPPRRLFRFPPGTVYAVNAWHYAMMNDLDRYYAYKNAIQRAVSPGDVVLDVGTGAGLTAMASAVVTGPEGHVYTVEADEELAKTAREIVNRNGIGDRVTVLHNWSTDVLPSAMSRPADVIVSETIGTAMLGEGQHEWIPDAISRLARPGARVIPASGRQYVTLFQSDVYSRLTQAQVVDGWNLDLMNKYRDTSRTVWSGGFGVGMERLRMQDISDPVVILDVDFRSFNISKLARKREFEVKATRTGTVHGAYSHFDLFEDDERSKEMITTHPSTLTPEREAAWGIMVTTVANEDDGEYAPPIEVVRDQVLHVSVWFSESHFRVQVRPG